MQRPKQSRRVSQHFNTDLAHLLVSVAAKYPVAVHYSPAEPSALVSGLVVISVVVILGVSAVIWFVHQRKNPGLFAFTAFEYHPPFRVLETDQSCLVEAEETDSTP